MTTGRTLPRWASVTLAVYAGAFLVGTVSHLLDFVLQGVEVYATAPLPLRVFFVALVVVDPLVVVLVLRRLRAGVLLALAVMVADVAGNLAMTALDPAWPFPVTQSLFGVFVLATSLPLWRVLGLISHKEK